jgi:putative transposase
LLQVNRSSWYYESAGQPEDNVTMMNEIYDIYHEWPFLGYRRITAELRKRGHNINRKRVQRLMALGDMQAILPKHKTTRRNKEHAVFPYLLKNLDITQPNQAWCVDITYIKISGGFVYLVALIDVYSRRIMGWELSPFLDTALCMSALNKALRIATPGIINSDQGCQFTSQEWVSALTAHGIQISMDGRGRWADNIYIERFWRSAKYELVHFNQYDTVSELRADLVKYMNYYNTKRLHQALGYETPDAKYHNHLKGETHSFPFLGNEEAALSNAALILV